ncbi:MAG: hypothetical protein ACTSW3_08850 [Promethearchaeota archaeon]
MKLFQRLIKTKFDEIQKLSNLKEKQYLEVISELKAEFETYKQKAEKVIKALKSKLEKQNGKTFYS